ncbi:Sucrose synthase [Arachis hypogaea]|nr:Sucrose synthase [Arachis hypogaea]
MAATSSSAPKLKHTNSITENMLDALRHSRYHMKRYFANYLEKRRRIMKLHHLMEKMEQVIDDMIKPKEYAMQELF